MNDPMATFDRSTEDLGNIVEFGHLNLGVPDQSAATLFYVVALGLTRDPYLMPGPNLMWVNVGQGQFHLPTRAPNVVPGTIGLVVPDIDALMTRCAQVRSDLRATKFDFQRRDDSLEIACPWGNRFRVHAPDAKRFGPVSLGLAYVEYDVASTVPLAGIAAFYSRIVEARAGVASDERGTHAFVGAGPHGRFVFRPAVEPRPFDGYHVQVTLANFSPVHRRLLERGLVTQESDQHQYRFQSIVDPDSGELLYTIEHEVRSMRHPLYGRPLVNRAGLDNRSYAHGREALSWSLPADAGE